MTPNRRIIVTLVAAALALPALARPASAESHKDTTYAFDDLWPAAVRHLRVREKLKITEKDAEAGYVLFELTDGGKVFPGSMELARIKDPMGRPALRLTLRIEDRPSYMEQGIIKRLFWKLYNELGPPPQPKEPPNDEPDKKPGKKPGEQPKAPGAKGKDS